MAFQKSTSGERLNLYTGNMKPWRPNAAYTTAGPARGDLVKQDTSGNGIVNICSSGDVPLGMVWSVNSGNGTLSILEFRDCVLVFQYTGTFAVGDKIVANGTNGSVLIGGNARGVVKHDNVNGKGFVEAVDLPSSGLCTVNFS